MANFGIENDATSGIINVKILETGRSKNFRKRFQVNRQSPLKILKAKFYFYVGLVRKSVLFIFKHRVIRDEDTAISIGLKDGDTIKTFSTPPKFTKTYNRMNVFVFGKPNVLAVFQIMKSFPLKVLKNDLHNIFGVRQNAIFAVNGQRIQDEDTPSSLQLKNFDCINVL